MLLLISGLSQGEDNFLFLLGFDFWFITGRKFIVGLYGWIGCLFKGVFWKRYNCLINRTNSSLILSIGMNKKNTLSIQKGTHLLFKDQVHYLLTAITFILRNNFPFIKTNESYMRRIWVKNKNKNVNWNEKKTKMLTHLYNPTSDWLH